MPANPVPGRKTVFAELPTDLVERFDRSAVFCGRSRTQELAFAMEFWLAQGHIPDAKLVEARVNKAFLNGKPGRKKSGKPG